MKFAPFRALVALTSLVVLTGLTRQPAAAQVTVWTYHYDNTRTGANTQETALTPENVNPFTFGKLFTQAADGQVYAQPLLVPNVAIPGKGLHNVVFICTMHDSVYAFDADSNADTNAQPLWKVALAPGLGPDGTGVVPVPASDVGNGYGDVQGEIGITSTPVIDTSTGTIYILAKTKEITGTAPNLVTTYVQRLHALDIATGAEKLNGPVAISASVPGVGYNGAYGVSDASNGQVLFDARNELQRAGLVLSNGRVYITWAAHEDHDPYHGWVIGYSASDLSQPPLVFCASPNGGRSGIWQGGMAPAADQDGNVYVMTGNGSVNPALGNYGDAVLKLGGVSNLGVLSYFIPFNQAALDAGDVDLGCSGPMLLPDQPGPVPHMAVGIGKEGILYLLDRDSLGGYGSTDDVLQTVSAFEYGKGPRGAPAYWNGRIYYIGFDDHVKAWSLSNGRLSDQPVSQSPDLYGYLGATPTVSSNGDAGGITWAVEIGDYASGGPAVLRAYDATDLSRVLYDSSQTNGRDTPGPAIKFSVPVVANGKVYVGTGTGFAVYGTIPDTMAPALLSVSALSNHEVTATFNRPIDSVTGADPTNYQVDHGVQVLKAVLSSDGRSITLSTSTLTPGISYLLTAANLLDRASPPHRIADGSGQRFVYVPLSGDGLLGEYYANTQNLEGTPVLTRVDPTIDFDWGLGAPAPEVGSDNFSVRWTGYVQPVTTETYTFYARTDDGVRLWVDGRPLLPSNAWSDHSATEYLGTVDLEAGRLYSIRMEMYEHGGGASARLAWSSATIAKATIPQAQLYSRAPAFGFGDASVALNIAGGMRAASTTDATRLNVESSGAGAQAVDLIDAIRLLRKAVGVDPNP